MFEFIQLMNEAEIDFVVVGAHALAHHGYPRYSGDIDILIRPELNDATKLITVLKKFGFGSLNLNASDFTKVDQVVQLGVEPNRIDILTGISGPDVESIFNGKEEITFNDEKVYFISKTHLIENKEATGRLKDLADVQMLKKK